MRKTIFILALVLTCHTISAQNLIGVGRDKTKKILTEECGYTYNTSMITDIFGEDSIKYSFFCDYYTVSASTQLFVLTGKKFTCVSLCYIHKDKSIGDVSNMLNREGSRISQYLWLLDDGNTAEVREDDGVFYIWIYKDINDTSKNNV